MGGSPVGDKNERLNILKGLIVGQSLFYGLKNGEDDQQVSYGSDYYKRQ